MQPQGLHDGYHCGILSHDHGGLSTMATPPNPTVVPTVSYEYLFCLPSSERFQPPARRMAQGLLSGFSTPETAGR
jgi:hypothetical protein